MKKLILIFLIGTSPLIAQEGRRLSLADAINYALEHKAEAQKARLDIQKGELEIAETKAGALPSLAISGNTSYNPLLQENVLPGEIFGQPGTNVRVAFGQKWTSTFTAQVNQTIFNQAVFTGLKAARSTREFYLINAELTEEQVIEKVATAYYQVYQAQQSLENLESNLTLTEQTVEIIQGLYESGLAKKIDYDRSQVALNNAKSNRQQVLNAVQQTENALKFMIGMSIDEPISLPEESFEPTTLFTQNADFLSQRTEVKLMNKQLELLEWQKKATEAEYYPTASLSASYGWLGQGSKMPWWNGESNGVFWSDLSSIGLNLRIPIFSGFATKSRVGKVKIEIAKAEADMRDTKLGLQLSYNNARAQLQNSLITIENQEKNVQLAESVLTDTQNNYSLGLATLNDMLDAERDLSDAKDNLTNAKLDYKLAEIELLKSEGSLRTLTEIK
ncbi:MAG: TolC family protein [Roseivirga sp.]|uniref:TolC family protein n=1 Tax=Roseivirga sp. TaxID=1964215 RepID=UPI001B1F249D|nr:TolC family protein [Roseivirga sp.]MBO6662241.1 TolC family protein [Roseivirga sp.]MBO6760894.1 TolC family protein [Roseivirga sp.]MBO6910253.1 TolC family protein [Roseivirga sp.]